MAEVEDLLQTAWSRNIGVLRSRSRGGRAAEEGRGGPGKEENPEKPNPKTQKHHQYLCQKKKKAQPAAEPETSP